MWAFGLPSITLVPLAVEKLKEKRKRRIVTAVFGADVFPVPDPHSRHPEQQPCIALPKHFYKVAAMRSISVIIPVYNTSAYLRACLDSTLQQREHVCQIILVDDGSTDESGHIFDNMQKNGLNL